MYCLGIISIQRWSEEQKPPYMDSTIQGRRSLHYALSMFYEDSPKGNRKDWRSHPRRTKGSVWADSRLDSLHLRSLRTLFHWDIGKLCVHNIWRALNPVYEGDYKEVLLWCCFWLFPLSAMLTCCVGTGSTQCWGFKIRQKKRKTCRYNFITMYISMSEVNNMFLKRG